MELQLQRPLVIFDLETTGLDISHDHIIQIAYIKICPDGRETRCNYLVNPGIPIPPDVSAITSITDEDVKDKPSFKDLAPRLIEEFKGCDFAGFNSNHFDIPMLAEEFLRVGANFDFSKHLMIDVQTIFHKMERRNLEAAYKFYCGRKMSEDFPPHRAENDTEATYRVLKGQLDMYSSERQTEKDRQLPNDMSELAAFSKTNDNVDFAGRIVWKPITDSNGHEMKDADGNIMKQEVFNFGKYKGMAVKDVLRRDPGYYNWMLNGDFSYNTKQALTRIRLKEFR